MRTIVITIGAPGSGKSHWTREQMRREPNRWRRVNKDDIRSMVADDAVWNDWNNEVEAIVESIHDQSIKSILNDGYDLIIDNTNLNARTRKRLHRLAENFGDVTVLERVFKTPIEECIKRDAQRSGRACVGQKVIENMYSKMKKLDDQSYYYPPKGAEQALETNLVKVDSSLPKAIICDIDGTIANINHRSPYDTAKCLDDLPFSHVVDAIQMFHQNGHRIIFCSGREDKFRDLTEQWLNANVGIEYDLFMRPSGNFEKDSLIKKNIFEQNINGKYNVRAVIDDRLQVCRLWFDLGLPLFRVGDPEANF